MQYRYYYYYFLTPVLNSQGMKKYAMQYKLLLLLYLGMSLPAVDILNVIR